MAEVTYNPAVFDVSDERAAKNIIVTPTPTQSADRRWEVETPYLADLLGTALKLEPDHLLIDYGCGIGRLSKALIERFGCRVLGVDISRAMRGLAPAYVQSEAFSVVSRSVLFTLASRGLRANAAIAVWVLQHCPELDADIRLIKSALTDGAALAVVNSVHRAIPAKEKAWVSDGQDVSALLADTMAFEREMPLDPIIGEDVASLSWCRLYRR